MAQDDFAQPPLPQEPRRRALSRRNLVILFAVVGTVLFVGGCFLVYGLYLAKQEYNEMYEEMMTGKKGGPPLKRPAVKPARLEGEAVPRPAGGTGRG